jgi:hypothetical protein
MGDTAKPGQTRIDHEDRDAAVCRGLRIGARGEPDVVGAFGTAGEHFLAVDEERVPSRTAWVRSAARSVPACGSV